MDNVTDETFSPQWMQDRLNACGMRPINNIVDISNYVMLETGMPNHIYDRDTIKGGEIIVRRMGEDGVFVTLDEQERHMIASDTMVCDKERVSGIGGIMGGLDSSIKDTTSRIFLESANWQDSDVRKTSVRLGLRTDASQRYEKSLDTNLLEQTILRLVELVKESCPEAVVVGTLQEDAIKPTPELKISCSAEKIARVLGVEVSALRIVEILETLDFSVAADGDSLEVTVPSYRATKDIEYEADIIEEIGRVIGYDNITPVSPINVAEATRLSVAKQMQRKIQDFMVFSGRALEVMTYPMIGEKLLEQASWPVMNEKLTLVNALAPELSRMRPSMIPTLLEKAAQNQKNFSSFRLFEMGRSYESIDGEQYSKDRYQLGVVFYDRNESPFMDLMNVMKPLMSYLNLNAQFVPADAKFPNALMPVEWPGIHPHEYLNIKVMGKNCGAVNTVHPIVARQFKIKGNVAVAIFDITDFMDREIKDKTKYSALPKFPSSRFDCTFIAAAQTPVSDVLRVTNKLKLKIVESVKIADMFTMSDEQKAVTLRFTFLDREKTLTHEVLRDAEAKIIATMEKGGFPLKK